MFTCTFVYRGYTLTVSDDTPELLALAVAGLREQFGRLPDNTSDAPAAAAPRSIADDVKGDTGGSEIIAVTEMSVEKTKDKQTFFKVKGGRFTTYGVALYLDTCRLYSGLEKNNLAHSVAQGLEARIERGADGKLRVASIRINPKNALSS